MNGGALIIGSLFWQDHRDDKKKDNIRKAWREEHLDKNNAIPVKLPIRYGRKSSDDVFTMVFSTTLERYNNLGIGYIIPFINNPLLIFEDLEKEALAMAKAEALGSIEKPCFFASWGGSLGIKFNPKLNENIKNNILQEWSGKYKGDGGGKDLPEYKVGNEKPSIDKYGRLSINWPSALNIRDKLKIDGFDFLIGSSNKPRYNADVYKYPKIDELVDSIKNDKSRYYFLNNLKSGIITYQDIRILKKLKIIT